MRRSERTAGAPRGGRARRTGRVLAAVLAGAALAAGCGIRSTSVPVDAGAAPSRVPCRTPAEDVTARALDDIAVQVYLVCASQLVMVNRSVRMQAQEPDRVRVAQALLDELKQDPEADERQAGFSTGVPAGLRVAGGRGSDPAGTLRLNEQPDDLAAEALAQLVCTYADSEALVTGGTVVLGGPGNYAPRGYVCTSRTKTRPGDVPTPGALELP
ncbi:hypothetical protein [Streptomyces fulvorobeus]|uniref:Lipoprotein n=1 Tax=Streptomyces fulvorobeus TaxID=284028 RepID=A0A7J0C9G4_9ACTN|nr:hypothetical protein [Streptomyces fulvorobeus]NYE42591.1 hypothetical protein [Streptomyces fulvorobeus]GFM98998.1 lipoprotein [Streptomyces fulvorobeus]